MGGRLAQDSLCIVIQSLIVVGLALAVGATFPDGSGRGAVTDRPGGAAGDELRSLSNALALVVRRGRP